MRKCILAALFWVCGMLCAGAAGIREGMSRAEVEAALGKPLSSMVQGETTILNYPDRGRVELVGGKVVALARVRHQDDGPTPEEEAAVVAAKETEATKAEEVARAKEEAAAQAEWARSSAEAQARMEASVEQMTAAPAGQTSAAMGQMGLMVSPAHFWIELGVGLLVQVGVGVVVLKLAFRWVDVHADWGQMVLPALASALTGAVVRAVAFSIWRTDQVFRVDDALSYGALLFTLIKTTHACTWQRAVGVAMAAKLMTIVVWVFLGVAISRLLFA